MSTVKEQKYSLSTEQKLYFASVLLLEDINNFGTKFPVLLEGDDEMLEPLFKHMGSKGWLTVEGTNYQATDEGRKVLKNYLEKLTEFRSVFKIYSAVDTGEGEFGYDKYFEFDTDEQFEDYINLDRFEDLRVAVCELKGINPLDVIFLEFVDTGRFDFEQLGWQAELVTGLIWDDMLEVANTNIHLEDLTEYDEEGPTFDGKEVCKMIVEKGTELMMDLIKTQAEEDSKVEEDDFEEFDEEEEVIETVTTVEIIEEPYYDDVYYEVYYDPFYISPCWGVYYY
jgi:DNA-binding PadR family transcriptional regulator